MGRSSPPFLYDRPSTYTFYGPTDSGFNPKAVTEASRTRVPPKQKLEGPLVNINRHPDSWGSFESKSTWSPMSHKTKDRVKYARGTQLGLRVVALLGALGSLFCSIVIKNVAVTAIWIIRAGPIVAILHTIYAIYHLCRSPVNRPPASQASYGLFASTLDAGLIPFYVFTAFMAHGEWTTDAYQWGTLFENSNATTEVAEATFLCALVNGGLHLVSLSLSIFLAIIFRKISQLPPDMNPLEDNLTARPRRSHKGVEIDEKHMSSSTLHSNLEDPLIGPPRSMPFMHTRGQSLAGNFNSGSMDMTDKRQSQISAQAHHLSYMEPSSPDMLFHQPPSQPYDITSQTPAPEYGNVSMHSPKFVSPSIQTRHLESRTADRSNSVSPMSDNWVAYSERSLSPMNEANDKNDNALRQSSSVYSRRTTSTATSQGGNGIRDWFSYGQKPASIASAIPEDTRGEYASLAMHEFYGNDEEKHEQDLGDRRFNIFPDPAEHDHDDDDEPSHGLPFNPLMLNPPTPQPVLTEESEDTDPVRRSALGENPSIFNSKAQVIVPREDANSSPSKGRYYGDLEEEGKPGLDLSREISRQEEMSRKPTKLSKKRNKKMAAYQSLKKNDSDDEGHLDSQVPSSNDVAEVDRKGRIVSNSGADTTRLGLVGGVGASLSSYGSYIAGLGVGRRRDVSGKMAEEGRGGKPLEESAHQSENQKPAPIRAAGWARFAGL
ncbi:hypothetical protein N7462_011061 [Penicillium macrosclerotiorum]|uniref:uncharacterized protein n=1 Tax=Penicillium macrosclerotiorum TaxID=303699 RepID=UPI0025478849|nr:uncharacterized protein N7462_011061 [Penicillium macrosclerotiorum]KAJ5666652.1 hypothetical protein N7462_011061 [Penicillium macrosclerotiorum]